MPNNPRASESAPPCHHPLVRKAYYLGLPGEGYVCACCGQCMPRPDGAAPRTATGSAPLRTEHPGTEHR